MDSTRTIAFVAASLIAIGAAAFTHKQYQPAVFKENTDEGEPFYPKYEDPNSATGLRVAHYNADESKLDVFEVRNNGGKWTIPSHNDYPADGETRLKDTAASVVGVRRQTLAGKSKDAHKMHGLLDPLDESISGTEGRGDRITLLAENAPLCDLIVGKKVEKSASDYYVRRPDEDRFYIADLSNFSISTKFTDWIEADLLDLSATDIREISLDRYTVDEARGTIVQGEKSVLSRETPEAEWKLQDLDETTSKVKTTTVSEMTRALDDIRIVGVRKKPEGLSADLKADEGISLTTSVALDLQDRGFFISPKQGILSNEGETIVGNFDGVMYVLRFGEVFTGTDVELEVGHTAKEKEAAKDSDKNKDDAQAAQADQPDKAATEPELKKSRYVFITCQFDESLLGPPPAEPVEPKKPEPASAPAEGEKPEAAADGAAPEKKDDGAADLNAQYQKDLETYKLNKEVYETKLKEWKKKAEAGEKRVKQLNDRFADWYYVISDDQFLKLSHVRSELIEPKEPPKVTPPGEAGPATPPKAEPSETPPAPPSAESKPEPSAESKPEPSAESKPEPSAEPKPEPAAEPKPEPAAESKPEPAAEAKPEPAAEAKPEPAAEAKSE